MVVGKVTASYGGSVIQVVKVKRKDNGEVFALKIMDKKHIIRENKVKYVKMERMILDQLDFPGVVRLCFTFQDVYSLCIPSTSPLSLQNK